MRITCFRKRRIECSREVLPKNSQFGVVGSSKGQRTKVCYVSITIFVTAFIIR